MSFDRRNPADLAALKSEVDLDPNGYGYNWANTIEGVELINLDRPEISLRKPKISSAQVRSGVPFAVYDRLLADRQEWLRWLTGSNGFEEENLVITDDVDLQLTGNGDPANSFWQTQDQVSMAAAMSALINVNGSRAEQLFGFGTIITRDDWIAARDS